LFSPKPMKHLKTHLNNLRGWRAPAKILVIQSDDWGALRTPSGKALAAFRSAGLPVDRCHYTRLDSLEGEEDLDELFRVLRTFHDRRGHPVRFTANCLMANPDFERIAAAGFQEYFFEPVTDTARRSTRTSGIVDLWKKGNAEGFFVPQLHGREHLNIERWIRDIKNNDVLLRLAFDHQTYAISSHLFSPRRDSYLAAFDSDTPAFGEGRTEIVEDAVRLFNETLGFSPESFIAPNYNWDSAIEAALSMNNVPFIQSSRAQQVSRLSRQGKSFVRRYQGQSNSYGQVYTVRNVQFEPAENPEVDWVGRALAEMASAFYFKKPAIVSTHRVNYMGHLRAENRKTNLKLLEQLIESALKRWPDVQFWTTAELGRAMSSQEVA